ncbi:dUTP diphosphatase, partial [Candidatus Woesearchaeota archaeon]|nr:dUTP diphosphatase [Candidatus Woesearchaeota archaeon]
MDGEHSLELKIKKLHPDACIPSYAKLGDAGLDLYAIEDFVIPARSRYTARTGIAIELPVGYEAQIRSRSGLASKHGVNVHNSPGTIDSGYRGEVMVILMNHDDKDYNAKKGDKIAQMIIHKHEIAKIVENEDLSKTE